MNKLYKDALNEIIELAEEAKKAKTVGELYDTAYDIQRCASSIQENINLYHYNERTGEVNYKAKI